MLRTPRWLDATLSRPATTSHAHVSHDARASPCGAQNTHGIPANQRPQQGGTESNRIHHYSSLCSSAEQEEATEHEQQDDEEQVDLEQAEEHPEVAVQLCAMIAGPQTSGWWCQRRHGMYEHVFTSKRTTQRDRRRTLQVSISGCDFVLVEAERVDGALEQGDVQHREEALHSKNVVAPLHPECSQ